MKVIHLISGGDSGGAKTHVHSLLQNLSQTIDVTMVCFMDGPFAQEARELGIHTSSFPGGTCSPPTGSSGSLSWTAATRSSTATAPGAT